jgi:hypothetical protein
MLGAPSVLANLTSTDRVRIARCNLIAAILRHPDLTDFARLRYLREHEETRQGLPCTVQSQLARNLRA